jgi:hypothetical protein
LLDRWLALGVRNQGPHQRQVERLHGVVVGQIRASSFTQMSLPDSPAEEADCSDLEHGKAVASGPVCLNVGTITTSEQSAIRAHRVTSLGVRVGGG